MRKKLLALIMAGLVLGLSACAATEKDAGDTDQVQSEQEDSEKEESKEPSQSEEIVEKEPEATPEPTKEPDETKEPEVDEPVTEVPREPGSGYLQVSVDYTYDSYLDQIQYMYGHFATLQLEDTRYPALTETINSFNAERTQTEQEWLDELETYAIDDFAEFGEESFFGPYVHENDMYVRRGDDQVLSVMTHNYDYVGGAHGGRYYTGCSFDVQTGKQILFEDVIVDKSGLAQALATELQEKYWDLEYTEDYWLDMLDSYVTTEPMDYKPEFVWTLDYDGVTFYFGNYELVAYAFGTQEVTLSYSEYPQLLNSYYFDSVEKTYVKNITAEQWNMGEDLDGDGQTDMISLSTRYDSDHQCIASYTVNVNNYGYTYETHAYDLETYLVRAGEKNYLYVQQTAESDFQTVAVFEIAPDGVKYVDVFTGGLSGFTNSEAFHITRRVDLLGTYFIQVDCQMGENGMPEETGKVYDVVGNMTIISTKEITADLISKEGKLLGQSYTFPVGTAFTFRRTDSASYIDMQAGNDQYCRFYVTSGWPETVNGMEALECFEQLFYAG